MNKLRQLKHCVMAVLLLAGLNGFCEASKPAKSGLDGCWTGTMSEAGDAKFTFTFDGARLDVRGPRVDNHDNWLRGSLVLNEKAQPKEMDLRVEEASNPKNLGSTVRLIYELHGDELKLAAAIHHRTVRPTNYVAGEGVQVYFLKRERGTTSEPQTTVKP